MRVEVEEKASKRTPRSRFTRTWIEEEEFTSFVVGTHEINTVALGRHKTAVEKVTPGDQRKPRGQGSICRKQGNVFERLLVGGNQGKKNPWKYLPIEKIIQRFVQRPKR
jgi:hypothetical protein